jgi:hypothetical protein
MDSGPELYLNMHIFTRHCNKLLLELRRSKPDGFHYTSAQEMYPPMKLIGLMQPIAFNEALLHLQGQSVEVLATGQ